MGVLFLNTVKAQETITPSVTIEKISLVDQKDASVASYLNSEDWKNLPEELRSNIDLNGEIKFVTFSGISLSMITFHLKDVKEGNGYAYVYTDMGNTEKPRFVTTQLIVSYGPEESKHYAFASQNEELSWSIDVNEKGQFANLKPVKGIDFSPLTYRLMEKKACHDSGFGTCMTCHSAHCLDSWGCTIFCVATAEEGICLAAWALDCLEGS